MTVAAFTIVVIVGAVTVWTRHFGSTAESQWRDAVLTGDVKTMDRLLQNGINPDMVIDANGRKVPALVLLAMRGDKRGMQSLLDHGADVDVVDEDSRTSLSYAAEQGDGSLVQYLLSNGAHVEPVDRFGWSPLLWAAHTRNAGILQILLDHGASVDFQCARSRNTALLMACGDVLIVRMLLERGADPELVGNAGMTALSCTMEWYEHTGEDDYLAMIDELLQLDLSYEAREFAVLVAAGAPSGLGRGEALRRVIDSGVDVYSARRGGGKSALHWAAEFGNPDAVHILLEAGADPLAQSSAGEMAIDLARKCEDEDGREIVSLLEDFSP